MTNTDFDRPTEISQALVTPGMNIGVIESYNTPNGEQQERRIAGRVQTREGVTVQLTDGTTVNLFPPLGTAYISIWGLPQTLEDEQIIEYFEEQLQEMEEPEPQPQPEYEPAPEPEPETEELHPLGAVAIIDIPAWDLENVIAQWDGDNWLLMGTSDQIDNNIVTLKMYARIADQNQTIIQTPPEEEQQYRDAITVLSEYELPTVIDNLYDVLEQIRENETN